MAATILAWEPGSAVLPASDPAQFGYTSGTNFPYMTLNFDATTPEAAYFAGIVPQAYAAGNIAVKLYWTATNTGNVVWGAKYLGRVDDEVLDSALSSQSTATDGVTAANDIMLASISIASPSLVAGDFIVLEIERVAGDGSDTCTVDAKLLAVEIQE